MSAKPSTSGRTVLSNAGLAGTTGRQKGEHMAEIDISEPKLNPPWKELVKVASDWKFGELHTHEEIAEILGVKYKSLFYYQNVNQAIKELIVIGKRLKNEKNIGYRTLNPLEQIQEGVYDAKKGVTRIHDGIDNLNHAPTNKMSDTMKRRHENTVVSLAKTYVTAVSGVTEAAQLAGIQRNQKMLQKGKED